MKIDSSMLAALTATVPNEVKDGGDFILYGDPKCGKTTTLDDPNMKVLVLDLEDGDSVLAGSENVDIVKIRTLEQLNVYCELLKERKWINKEGKIAPIHHGMVALDSITRMCDLVKDYVVRVIAPNRQREIKDGTPLQKFGAKSDWGNYGTIITDLVKYIHTLTKRGELSINFMWLAHRDNKYENPMIETQITGTQIKMQGSSVPIVMSVVDGIFYMNKGEITNKKTGDTNMYYWIQTDKMGIVEAGVRQSRRETKLPERIFNPVWSDILVQLGYKVELIEKK